MHYEEYCKDERTEIENYQSDELDKFQLVNSEEYEAYLQRAEKAYISFYPYGWNDKQVRN